MTAPTIQWLIAPYGNASHVHWRGHVPAMTQAQIARFCSAHPAARDRGHTMTRRDCWDWPERPHLAALSAEPEPVAPAHVVTGPTGGGGFATLLTLAAIGCIGIGAYGLVWCAWFLIQALMLVPLVGVIVGSSLLFGGLIAHCLMPRDDHWYVEDDEQRVTLPSGLMGVRFE